jgi:hypothetical protein
MPNPGRRKTGSTSRTIGSCELRAPPVPNASSFERRYVEQVAEGRVHLRNASLHGGSVRDQFNVARGNPMIGGEGTLGLGDGVCSLPLRTDGFLIA